LPERLRIATVADDFELPDLSGARHRFADLRGEVTLLNFWSPT
jgi:peroxiredoxin